MSTDNPLYTDIRYNGKICNSDNLTVTKPSLKRLTSSQKLVQVFNTLKIHMFLDIC